MAKIETQYVLVGRDQTKRAFGSVRKSLNSVRKAAFSLQGALTAGFAAATIKSIASAGVEVDRLRRTLTAATGSAEEGAKQLAFVRAESERLGINFQAAANSFARFTAATRGTALAGAEAQRIFSSVAGAASVLGLSAEQTQGTLTALEQIVSKGTVSAEELRGQLGERLPGAFQIAARSIGVTTQELDKLLRNGELTAEELLPALANELNKTFGAQTENAAQSSAAAFQRFSNAIFDVKIAIAESGILDFLATSATAIANLTKSVSGFFSTTLQERQSQLKQEIAAIEQTSAALNPFFQEKLASLKLELDLTEDRITADARAAEERKKELAIAERIAGINEIDLTVIKQKRLEIDQRIKAGERELAQIREKQKIEADRIRESQRVEGIEEIDISGNLKAAADLQKEFNSRAQEYIGIARESARAQRELGFTFSSAFEDAIVEGKKLRDVMQGLLKDILRIAIRKSITEPFGNFLGGLFGGFRASGGPVTSGKGYVVGEKGPEFFVPGQSGSIIPNNAMGGMSVNFAPTTIINTDGGLDAETLVPILDQNNRKLKGEIVDELNRGQYA